MGNLKTIENKIQNLPPDLIDDLNDYINFLLSKSKHKKKRKLKQDWAGSLGDISNNYSSIELQKKALEWRIG